MLEMCTYNLRNLQGINIYVKLFCDNIYYLKKILFKYDWDAI